MDRKRYKKSLRNFSIILINLGILISIIDLNKDINNNSEREVNNNEIINSINIPEGYEYKIIDGRYALVKYNEYHENKDINVPEGYTAEVYYYGYKTLNRKSGNRVVKEYVYIDAEEVVLDNGKIEHIVPDGYTLGIKYRLIPLEEIIYLDENDLSLKLTKKSN